MKNVFHYPWHTFHFLLFLFINNSGCEDILMIVEVQPKVWWNPINLVTLIGEPAHNIMHIHNIVLWDWHHSKKYSWIFLTFPRMMSVPQNTIIDLNNVMPHSVNKSECLVECLQPLVRLNNIMNNTARFRLNTKSELCSFWIFHGKCLPLSLTYVVVSLLLFISPWLWITCWSSWILSKGLS